MTRSPRVSARLRWGGAAILVALGGSLACSNPPPAPSAPDAPPPLDATIEVWPATATVPANLSAIHLRREAGFDPARFHAELVSADGAPRSTSARLVARVGSPGGGDGLPRDAELAVSGLEPGERAWLWVMGGARAYQVGPADHTAPSAADIRVRAPTGPRDPLTVRFGEPVAASARAAIVVLADGVEVVGVWSLSNEQHDAVFVPERAWPAGPLFLAIASGVTDLAGNLLSGKAVGPAPLTRYAALP